MTTRRPGAIRSPPPALEVLRAQLGDAVLEARIAEARGREEVLTRLVTAIPAGMKLEEAARHLGLPASASTLRRWLARWRAFGVAGLVDQQAGPPRRSAQAMPAGALPQLSLEGIPDPTSEGNLGLLRAVQKFDPFAGTRFTTYAVWWIRAYIGR